MNIRQTNIPDVLLVEPVIFQDDRGFFLEAYQKEKYIKAGITGSFVQDNQSGSKQGVLRGLHYQIQQPQGKLIWLVAGEVFDVAVDLRRSSPTFGKAVCVTLSARKKNQIWIPPGYAHGFYVVSDWAEVVYKATDIYAPAYERTLLWNDPALGIDWPLVDGCAPSLSVKDAQGCPLSKAETYE